MAIREHRIDGELVLSVDTAADFDAALARDLPIEAPLELVRSYGIEEDPDIRPSPDAGPDHLLPPDAA